MPGGIKLMLLNGKNCSGNRPVNNYHLQKSPLMLMSFIKIACTNFDKAFQIAYEFIRYVLLFI